MESQVENAIQIAWDPSSSQELKRQAFEFINQLRSNPQGPQACLSLFTRTPKSLDHVRLVSLDVINFACQNPQLDAGSLAHIKDSLLEYIGRTYGQVDGRQNPDRDTAALQNKLSHTMTLLFVVLYKDSWGTFFDEFLALTSSQIAGDSLNLPGVVFFLKLLDSVHDEIADAHIATANSNGKRNTELKDLLRARDAQKIAGAWQQILKTWQGREDSIVELTLKVVGKWVDWIDISLVVNEETLNLLFSLVGRENSGGGPTGEDKVRAAAINTITEISSKKMKSADKIRLFEILNLSILVSQLVASPNMDQLRQTSSYDVDLAESISKLVNTTTADIVRVLEDTKAETQTRAQAEQLLQNFLPHLLRFFSDEYDEVCSQVIPSMTDLLTFLRKAKPLPQIYSAMLSPILNAIIQKMRYDETSEWGNEDEQTDEAEFQDLRKKLQVLQKSVSAVDEDLYIEILSNVIGNTFQKLSQQGGQMDWRDLDLALHEMYLFGELTVPNGGLYTKSAPSSVAAERLIIMMAKMVESGLALFSHPAIQLQYMEICVRYCSFFESQTSYIPQVLEQFVQLVHHQHIRVRTRSWYLFFKFVKQLRSHIGNVAETVIKSISDLLPIQAEVPEDSTEDDMSSEQSDHSADATFNGQLYLFEAIGSISSEATIPVDKQILFARSIMNPLFSEMEKSLPAAKAGESQPILQIHHVISALGTLANGFSDWVPGNNATASHKPAKEVTEEFSRASEAVLIALESLRSSSEVRAASRATFSRLMGVMGPGMLPLLPRWIDGLLSQSSSKDEMAMFLRLLDQVLFGFKKEIYSVLDSLLTPLLQLVFNGLAEPITGTDDEIQLAELRREYLTFVQVILNNELGAVLVSDRNQAYFETLINSVTTLAKTVAAGQGNFMASRLAFSVLSRMADLWGGPNIATLGTMSEASSEAPTPAFPGFDRFMIEHFHPICWEVLGEPTFHPSNDALAKQVLNEIAGLEQVIYLKTGDMFIQHLRDSFFPAMGIDGTEFMRLMVTSTEKKVLATYLLAFLKSRRMG